MNKTFLILATFVSILVIFLTLCIIFIHTVSINKKSLEKDLYIIAEESYFEGQKDALENDIRIKKQDSTWIWIKSPWDSGRIPIFNPSLK